METDNQKPDDAQNKAQEKEPAEEEPLSKKSDKTLLWSIIFLVVILILFFSVRYLFQKPPINTIEDLNNLNIEGKLKSDDGYLYDGAYSFVKQGGLWYTQLKSPSGNVEYNIALHFGPREAESVKIEGRIDNQLSNSTDIYISLDPLNRDPATALAVSELTGSLIKSFGKNPIIVCDKNETEKCKTRPILTCENKDKAIIHFKTDEETKIVYKGNCIEIHGTGIEQVKAVDRILLKWYGIME